MNARSGFAPIALLLIVLVAATGLMTLAQHEEVFKNNYTPDVKGALIARGGDESGSSTGGSGESSGGNGGSTSGGSGGGNGGSNGGGGNNGGGSSGSGGSGSGGNLPSQSGIAGEADKTISSSSVVDCIGPDGRHFQVTKQGCGDFNKAWGRPDWQFVPLKDTPAAGPKQIEVGVEQEATPAGSESRGSGTRQGGGKGPGSIVGEDRSGVPEAEVIGKQLSPEVEKEIEATGSGRVEFVTGVQPKLIINAPDGSQKVVELPQAVNFAFGSGRLPEVRVRPQGPEIEIEAGGVAARTDLPVTLDKETGEITAQTADGQEEVVRVLPDKAAQAAVLENGGAASVSAVRLAVPGLPNAEDRLVFRVETLGEVKLLGIFPLQVPAETEIGAASGKVLSTSRPFWANLLAPLLSKR